jgi:hypothetical protein
LHDIRVQKQGFNYDLSDASVEHSNKYGDDCSDLFTEAFGLPVHEMSGCASLIKKEAKRF